MEQVELSSICSQIENDMATLENSSSACHKDKPTTAYDPSRDIWINRQLHNHAMGHYSDSKEQMTAK